MRSWLPFAFGEGVARTGSLTTIKAIGLSITTFGEAIVATAIIGLVQVSASIALARCFRILWLGWPFFLFCSVFGLLATAQTVIPFLVFSQGGELAVFTCLVVGLSIVPATVLDILFFGTKLSLRGWLGVFLAAFAGYLMLGMPTLGDALRFPSWVLLSLVAMLAFATNQIIARKLSGMGDVSDNKKRGLAQNAQVGVVTFLACGLMILVLGFDAFVSIASSSMLLIGSVFVGLWVVAIIASGLMAYARGANIALMRVVATATFLFGSALMGWLLFGEAFGLLKVAALLLFIAAFTLISRDRI